VKEENVAYGFCIMTTKEMRDMFAIRKNMNCVLLILAFAMLTFGSSGLVGYCSDAGDIRDGSFGSRTFDVVDIVEYPEFEGVETITYRSTFFGFNSAVSRSYTNYGWQFTPADKRRLDVSVTQLLLADLNGDGLDDVVGFDGKTGKVVCIVRTEAVPEQPRFVLPGSDPEETKVETGIGYEYQWKPSDGIFVAGDFDGDGYADIALVNHDGKGNIAILYNDGNGSFGAETVTDIEVYGGQVVAGDFDGDGIFDLCVYDNKQSSLRVLFGKGDGTFPSEVESKLDGISGGQIVAADFNQSRWWDIAIFDSYEYPNVFVFMYGRGDGTFGPREEEIGTRREMNLTAWYFLPQQFSDNNIPVAGNIEWDLPAGIGIYELDTKTIQYFLHRGIPAYDYSTHLIYDTKDSMYKLWYGARWRTLGADAQPIPFGDGDHIAYAYSLDGTTWFREIAEPIFYKGEEDGSTDWWRKNYLEPEVIRVGDTYYLFYQVMIVAGDEVDTGEIATTAADRILLAVSKDGVNWERKTDRGVVINLTNPEATKLTHQEVIYVPDDVDGKPWWMYVYYIVDGQGKGHVRLRSDDPTTFDWRDREPVSGMAQLGNQIAYADEAPGGRLFFRITFTSDGERRVPTFQLSRDGLRWQSSRTRLAGSDHESQYMNMYFLGVSTIDGTGKMEYLGNGQFRALYGGTTSNSSTAPEIFYSEIGVGEVIITFDEKRDESDAEEDGSVGILWTENFDTYSDIDDLLASWSLITTNVPVVFNTERTLSKQSVEVVTNGWIEMDLGGAYKDITVQIMFYDPNDDAPDNCGFVALVDSGDGKTYFGNHINIPGYQIRWPDDGGWKGANSIRRTEGWHVVEFVLKDGVLDVYLDGNKTWTRDPSPLTDISKIQLGNSWGGTRGMCFQSITVTEL
jgi:hypothetical protein